MRYQVIESRHWQNAKTGQTASIYGAMPHGGDWFIQSCGWSIRDTKENIVFGRNADRDAVAARCDVLNNR